MVSWIKSHILQILWAIYSKRNTTSAYVISGVVFY